MFMRIIKGAVVAMILAAVYGAGLATAFTIVDRE